MVLCRFEQPGQPGFGQGELSHGDQTEAQHAPTQIQPERSALAPILLVTLPYLLAVLWIRDILVRIRIRGSVPLTYFVCGWKDANKKKFVHVFFLITFLRYIYIGFHWQFKRSYKKVEMKVSLLFLLVGGRIRIRIRTKWWRIRIHNTAC